MTSYLLEWAWSAAILGWLYSALARLWPQLFHRDVLPHAVREPQGYRLGRAVYWQLPARAAIVLGLAALIPILAVVSLPEGLSVATLALFSVAQLILWLAAPPGQCLSIVEISPPGEAAVFALRSANRLLRAAVVLLVLGLVPASLGGMVLSAVWRSYAR